VVCIISTKAEEGESFTMAGGGRQVWPPTRGEGGGGVERGKGIKHARRGGEKGKMDVVSPKDKPMVGEGSKECGRERTKKEREGTRRRTVKHKRGGEKKKLFKNLMARGTIKAVESTALA